MNRILTVSGLCFVLLIVLGLSACQRTLIHPVFLKGPYLQNVKMDGVTIMWESSIPAIGKVVFGKSRAFGNTAVEMDSTTIHEITLTGLDVESVYHYYAISGGVKSPAYTFKTSVGNDSPFSFAVYGDNKNGPFIHSKNTDLILTKNPSFVIHNGDLVDRGYVYKQWEKLFFTPARRIMSHVPLFPVLGNHEEHAKLYYDFFSLPGNEQWYSFDFGNAHFIILDSDKEFLDKDDAQINWLIDDLQKNTATWTFVNFHHPPFTAGGGYYDVERIFLKNLLHPIFEEYGVDVVMSGDDHNYERTFPIVSKNGEKPITYIVSGNGGTPMRYVHSREWTLYSERVFGFVIIHIDGTKLHFQSINIDDEVIDEFTLDKSDSLSLAGYEENRIFFEDIHDPVEAARYRSKGKQLYRQERFSEALAEFEKAYHVDTTCVEALGRVAQCYEELGQFGEAISTGRRAIQKMPNYPNSYEALIDAYVSQKKYDEALEWCRKWFLIEPDQPDANETMAEIYAMQEKYVLAIKEMKRALQILPSEAELYFELGEIYEVIGDLESALLNYQQGLEWFTAEEDSEEVEEAHAIRTKVDEWTGKP